MSDTSCNTTEVFQRVIGLTVAKEGHGGWYSGKCPAHPDRTASLGFKREGWGIAFKCHAGCSRSSIVEALGNSGLALPRDFRRRSTNELSSRKLSKQEHIDRLIRNSFAIENSRSEPARKYFQEHRGLNPSGIGENVRFHPGVYNTDLKKECPAIIAIVKSDLQKERSIQLTYLTENSTKIIQAEPRKTLGSMKGKSVHIGPAPTAEIIVAEGLETAIACHLATGISCYATLGASNMPHFVPPNGVTHVRIAADRDPFPKEVGLNAAKQLASNLLQLGLSVSIHQSPRIEGQGDNSDWADHFQFDGPEATKERFFSPENFPKFDSGEDIRNKSCAEKPCSAPWPAPEPLKQELPKALDLPFDRLPENLKSIVAKYAQEINDLARI
jgi:putative DNA primase/helicase